MLVLAYAATLMGLRLLKPWARTMYTALFVVGVALIPLMGASIIDPATAAVDHLVSVCSGVILALLYSGDARGRFAAGDGLSRRS